MSEQCFNLGQAIGVALAAFIISINAKPPSRQPLPLLPAPAPLSRRQSAPKSAAQSHAASRSQVY